MPTISVIVPVYKVEPYLRRCVDSILNQTYTDFELILVDDGSPDGCPALCDEYAVKDSRIRVIHKSNGGVSSARNAGLEVAQGEYITFVDSDDYIRPHLLNRVYQQAVETGMEMVSFSFIATSKKEENAVDCKKLTVFNTLDVRKKYLLEKTQHKNGGWEVWSYLYKASLIQNNSIRFCLTCNNFAEDLGFVLNCILCANGIVQISDQMYIYDDTRDGSMMNRSRGLCKVNEMNEVSKSVEPYYLRKFGKEDYFKIHHEIIMNQIGLIRGAKQMKEAFDSVNDREYFIHYNEEYYKNNSAKCLNRSFPYGYLKRCRDRFLYDGNYSRICFEEILARPFIIMRSGARRILNAIK